LIGNDIVDLHYFESPFYQHIRYLDKVCTPKEAAAVRKSKNAVRVLAAAWAAKEAAYKLATRNSNLRHFVPRDFVTDLPQSDPWHYLDELLVSWNEHQTRVKVAGTAQWLHAIAISSQSCKLRWRVREIARPALQAITPKEESDASRDLAKELLQECGLKNLSLGFSGKIPALRQSGPCHREIAISLSHHGRFAAAAVAWTPNKSQQYVEAQSGLVVNGASRAA